MSIEMVISENTQAVKELSALIREYVELHKNGEAKSRSYDAEEFAVISEPKAAEPKAAEHKAEEPKVKAKGKVKAPEQAPEETAVSEDVTELRAALRQEAVQLALLGRDRLEAVLELFGVTKLPHLTDAQVGPARTAVRAAISEASGE